MQYNIALIPGDGIGLEVIPEAVRVLERLAEKYGFQMDFETFPYSCTFYREHGFMMPEGAIEQLKGFEGKVLKTSLSADEESGLRAALEKT